MKRRKFTPGFKFKVAVAAISEQFSLPDLTRKHQLAPAQISTWKRELLSHGVQVFQKPTKATAPDPQVREDELLRRCRDLVAEAIAIHRVTPDIFNTDQGAQYTSQMFTEFILSQGMRLSMDGKGTATDNAFIERLWRSIKYERLYLHEYETGKQLYDMVDDYLAYYNTARRHSSIGDDYPAVWYRAGKMEKSA